MTERMNVRRVQAPEASEYVAKEFEAVRDVTQEDWKNIRAYVDHLFDPLQRRWENTDVRASECLIDMHILNPKEALPLHVNEPFVRKWLSDVERWNNQGEETLEIATIIKWHFDRPRTFLGKPKKDWPLSQTEWSEVESQYQQLAAGGAVWPIVKMVTMSRFAGSGSQSLPIESSITDVARSSIEQQDANILGAISAAQLRLLGHETHFIDTDKGWGYLKQDLQRRREKKIWGDFLALASAMKILAADEVRITEKGVECIEVRKPRTLDERKTWPPTVLDLPR